VQLSAEDPPVDLRKHILASSDVTPPNGWRGVGQHRPTLLLLFFFITLKPRVKWYTKSVSLKYDPASEPPHSHTAATMLGQLGRGRRRLYPLYYTHM